MRRKVVQRKMRKDRERKRYTEKSKLEQIDQPSPAPTREEAETEETEAPTSSFKHEATKHRSLRRAEDALSRSSCQKKEIVTSLPKKYSVRIVFARTNQRNQEESQSLSVMKKRMDHKFYLCFKQCFSISNAFVNQQAKNDLLVR